jgi:glycerophosphoryl diester phosphodiesterase
MTSVLNHTPALSSRSGIRELVNIGHRGASAYAPENTIAAFDLALSLGVHYLELDVHMTKDGVLVVFHDPTIERTVRGNDLDHARLIGSTTLAELDELDVGSWFNEVHQAHRDNAYTGLSIVSLEHVLARYRHCARFCIELKHPETTCVEEELVRLLDRYDLLQPTSNHRVLVLSFDRRSLAKLSSLRPSLPLTQLFDVRETSRSITAQLDGARLRASYAGVPAAAIDETLVSASRRHHIGVFAYTVNEAVEMQRLIELGVDGIITDYPDRLDHLLRTQRLGTGGRE